VVEGVLSSSLIPALFISDDEKILRGRQYGLYLCQLYRATGPCDPASDKGRGRSLWRVWGLHSLTSYLCLCLLRKRESSEPSGGPGVHFKERNY